MGPWGVILGGLKTLPLMLEKDAKEVEALLKF
jgi:hypothetical protein